MYEQFFGLSQRPFSTVPRPDEFVALPTIQEALDSLIHCISQSRGIGVITSAPGMGKTLLCKRLAALLQQECLSVYLGNGGFQTRRALLQAILFELGISYVGLSEQEARLQLLERARQTAAAGGSLLLIVDEAHLLNPRLFEELRTLTDYAPEGTSIIRLVLSGPFELEEKLTDPALSALNQRIGTQVTLDSLRLEQSAQFITQRLLECGAEDVAALITPAGLELICRASDGNLRCLTQLADHAFLLAFAEEQRQVDEPIVRAALDDLKELPLQWNDVSGSETAGQTALHPAADFEIGSLEDPNGEDTVELEIPRELKNLTNDLDDAATITEPMSTLPFSTHVEESKINYAVIEVGSGISNHQVTPPPSIEAVAVVPEAVSVPAECPPSMPNTKSDLREAVIVDRYATLDRLAELPDELKDDVEIPTREEELAADEVLAAFEMATSLCRPPRPSISEEELLTTVRELRSELSGLASWQSPQRDFDELVPGYEETYRLYDVVAPSRESRRVEPVDVRESVSSNEAASDTRKVREEPADAHAPSRRFAQLFTRLRDRRRRIANEHSDNQ